MTDELPIVQIGQQPTSLTLLVDRTGENSRLPVPLTPFIGREHEGVSMVSLLRRSEVRLLTVTGAGGVGKTRLAIEAASQVAPDFPDGVAFVTLGSTSDPALVGLTIARALGLRDVGSEPPQARLAKVLARARFLLVLDNFERIVAAAPLLSELLERCPGLTLLVTSRMRLRLSGEREFPVGPLQLPDVAARFVADLAGQADAIQLFVERAQAVKPNFSLDAQSFPTIAEIVRRLDGLPLAIELAAVRLKVLPPRDLLDRLESRLPLLTGGARDLPARQQTMRDTIAWSFDLLSAPEQALFRRLAVFDGGFTLPAAERVVSPLSSGDRGGSGEMVLEPEAILDGISTLVEQSLLGLGPTSHYMMLGTVREFAWERLEASSETGELRRRHAAFFLALAEGAEPHLHGPDQAAWLDRLESDHANMRAALAWATEHDPEQALRLAAALRVSWRIRGHLGEGAAALERASRSGAGTPATRAKALVALASIRNLQADYETAARLAEEARSLFASLGDRRGIAEALRRIAARHVERGMATEPFDGQEFAKAEALWQEEITIRRELGDHDGIAWALQNLGFRAMMQGDASLAAKRFEEALAIYAIHEDSYGMGFALAKMGRASILQDDDVKAAMHYSQALGKFRDLKDPWGAAYVLEETSWLVLRMGQPERAARLLAAAGALRDADGVRLSPVNHSSHERALDSARRALPDAIFAAATAQGQKLSIEMAVAEALQALAQIVESKVDVSQRLTPREREVVQLLVEGKSDREIGIALELSPRTVGVHVSHVLSKLGAESRTAAVAIALRQGLV